MLFSIGNLNRWNSLDHGYRSSRMNEKKHWKKYSGTENGPNNWNTFEVTYWSVFQIKFSREVECSLCEYVYFCIQHFEPIRRPYRLFALHFTTNDTSFEFLSAIYFTFITQFVVVLIEIIQNVRIVWLDESPEL